jgi:hypothetical protein
MHPAVHSCAYRAINLPTYESKFPTIWLRLDWLATGLPHKHLGLYCVDPLCAACFCFPTSTTGAPAPLRACGPLMEEPRTVSGRTEPSISKEKKRRARNDRPNFVLSIRLPRNRKRSFMCRKSATRDPQLYFPSEGRHA